MTQYLMSVHHTAGEAMPPQDEIERMYADVDAFNSKLQASGAWVFAGGLVDRSEASVVDATSGADSATVTDGPFSEAREWLGGFWVVEAPDLEAALAIAKDGSQACGAPVEVRAFQGE
ncbi:YciI family protein [Intrasporangium sp. YIM S08009]|uniref:YciI family protein n=1 Tax=Intrasporangium zincisolvens TaxID=3080018 RepID=UPI002B0600D3|nr:YciI family protein [Intrasporangium sp. YIM S08009]